MQAPPHSHEVACNTLCNSSATQPCQNWWALSLPSERVNLAMFHCIATCSPFHQPYSCDRNGWPPRLGFLYEIANTVHPDPLVHQPNVHPKIQAPYADRVSPAPRSGPLQRKCPTPAANHSYNNCGELQMAAKRMPGTSKITPSLTHEALQLSSAESTQLLSAKSAALPLGSKGMCPLPLTRCGWLFFCSRLGRPMPPFEYATAVGWVGSPSWFQ